MRRWVEEKGNEIIEQLRSLGASADWSRLAYTMDAKCTKATMEAFLRLHAKGKIYRANRIVNWDTSLQSAISDAEVCYWLLMSLSYAIRKGQKALSRWWQAAGRTVANLCENTLPLKTGSCP